MISAEDLKKALINASLNISKHKKEVDDLNVFPVPDGDTGTNLSLTLENCIKEISDASDIGAGELADKAACALMRGARGNSGVIFALIFKGFAQSVDGLDYIDAKSLAKGLECGCDEAYAALEKPTEGTMLTVIRIAASKAASAVEKGQGSKAVFKAALSGAKNALKSTPNLLPILKRHSVVDSGGQGLVFIMEGMLSAEENEYKKEKASSKNVLSKYEEIRFGYCTEFLINCNENFDLSKLRRFLSEIGDSTVAVKGKDFVKVHVHTNSPDLAIGKGLEYGELSSIKIDNMRLQVSKEKYNCELVGICSGSGIRKFLEGFDGVHALECREAFNASAGGILEYINNCVSDNVFVLANNKNNILAAGQAAEMTDKKVFVVPSKNVVEGIAAAKAFNPLLSSEENSRLTEKAISQSVSGSVTFAARHGKYEGKSFTQGQIIGLSGNEIICCDEDICTSAVHVISHLINQSGRRKVTLFYGMGADINNARKAAKLASSLIDNLDIKIIEGGQPVYYYLISVE